MVSAEWPRGCRPLCAHEPRLEMRVKMRVKMRYVVRLAVSFGGREGEEEAGQAEAQLALVVTNDWATEASGGVKRACESDAPSHVMPRSTNAAKLLPLQPSLQQRRSVKSVKTIVIRC